jgi:hypothetical protein
MSKFLKGAIEHVQIKFDPANATTGLLVNYNVGSVLCRVKASFHVVTQASSGQLIDIGYTATSGEKATNILDGGSAVTGAQGGLGETIVCLTAIVPADYYITAYNVATHAATVATAIVGYLDLEITRYPIRVGDQ